MWTGKQQTCVDIIKTDPYGQNNRLKWTAEQQIHVDLCIDIRFKTVYGGKRKFNIMFSIFIQFCESRTHQ
jgi:hypothetical protein